MPQQINKNEQNSGLPLIKKKHKVKILHATFIVFVLYFLILSAIIWGLWAWYSTANFQNMVYSLDMAPSVLEFVFVSVAIVILTLILAVVFSIIVSKPIKRLSKKAIKLSEGEFNMRFGKCKLDEINKLCQALNFAANEFDKDDNFCSEFVANITHDLITPLTIIKAYAELIRDLSASGDKKSMIHAQVVIDEAERLAVLVSDIQRLSKIKSGRDMLFLTEFDFNEFCKSIINRFNQLHAESGCTINYESPEGIFVHADADMISRVLFNLIGNAINYAKNEDKQIKVSISIAAAKMILVQIMDNGEGISEEELAMVWARYYRARQTKRFVSGSGLGLSIVKEILEAHQVEYGATSKLGEGTTFWFKLKLAYINVKSE